MASSNMNQKTITKALQSTQNIQQLHHETNSAFKTLQTELSSMNGYVGTDGSTSFGRKLIKTGTFLIVAIPEPFISDITGWALVATGFALNRFQKKKTLGHYLGKFHEEIQGITQFTKELTHDLL